VEANPDIFQDLLSLLRQYGWETGLARLEAETSSTPNPAKRALLQQFRGWMAAERGEFEEALGQFQETEQVPVLGGWSVYGQAFVAHRRKNFNRTHELLDRAAQLADPADRSLQARVLVLRGTTFLNEGKLDLVLPLLQEALERAGRSDFATGRVLDALGQFYATRDNFDAARMFYEQALQSKEQFGDDVGLALTHGQLGRLYLDWGQLDRAQEHFEKDLEIARRIGDGRGEAQMYDHLGQVALAREDGEAAAAWLDESLRRHPQAGDPSLHGYAHKDRALAFLGAGNLTAAEEQIRQSEARFREADLAQGLALAARVHGILFRAQGKYDEAERSFRAALGHFEAQQIRAEMARTQLEVARTLRARGSPRPLIVQALQTALASAEACRRAVLVHEIASELRAVDEAAHWRHAYHRVRGRSFPEETDSLVTGVHEPVTVLFFDLKGSTDYGRTNDPEVVMMSLNQMMAELEAVLRRHRAEVTAYLGDGFMSILRGVEHAPRAVQAALALTAALRDFNRPRQVLGLPPFAARIGLATGPVFLGNVGTYHKMDYTAIGHTVNLAARLQSEAEPDVPCLSRATQEAVRDRFAFQSDQPRTVTPKGIGPCEVWDVVGPKL
jgi:class 3 adenylate cyclase/tetratricopeptide (TPR) repeat protein